MLKTKIFFLEFSGNFCECVAKSLHFTLFPCTLRMFEAFHTFIVAGISSNHNGLTIILYIPNLC